MKELAPVCPHCQNDDRSMLERLPSQTPMYRCEVCSKTFVVPKDTKK